MWLVAFLENEGTRQSGVACARRMVGTRSRAIRRGTFMERVNLGKEGCARASGGCIGFRLDESSRPMGLTVREKFTRCFSCICPRSCVTQPALQRVITNSPLPPILRSVCGTFAREELAGGCEIESPHRS